MSKKYIGTDLEYLRNMSDEEAHANALADPDAQPWTEEDLASGKLLPVEELIFDQPTWQYFRSQADDYKGAMLKVLRDYAASHLNPNS